jgi:RND family efflux transporter MFP subunit
MSRSRSGSASTPLILLFSIITLGLLVWAFISFRGEGDGSQNGNILRPGATTHQIVRQHLVISVTEDANLESASNVEVKCKVTGGTTILKIVDDGTYVKKGDEIVVLDSSGIEEQKLQQEGILERAIAVHIQATQDEGAAKTSIDEYLKGLFVIDKLTAEALVEINKENLQSAQALLVYTEKMARKGFVSENQVKADTFAVKRANLELKSAVKALEVLQTYTKEKMEKQLTALYEAAKARTKAEGTTKKLEQNKYTKLSKQMENCTIVAPQDGMVVYANERSRSGNIQIEVGAPVRQTQTILRLPDLKSMQAKVLVNESKIELLMIGMDTEITIQGRVFHGEVKQIANQPESKSWYTAQVKEYATIVSFDGETKGLKPGMTAHVEITIREFPDQLVIPVAAVVEQRRGYYCWVKTPRGVERRPLELGMTDDKVIAVKDGVVEGDIVILNPRAVVPEARDEPKSEDDDQDEGNGKKKWDGKRKGGGNYPGKKSDGTKPAKGDDDEPADSTGQRDSAGGSGGRPSGGGFKLPTFEEKDANGDGKITVDEVTGRMADNFETYDADGDGSISKAEFNKTMSAVRARIQQGSGGGGPR